MDDMVWQQREQGHVECSEVIAEIELGLASALNDLHELDRPVRYWELIAGFWVRNFVDVVSSRLQELEAGMFHIRAKCGKTKSVTRTSEYMWELTQLGQSIEWNQQLIADISAVRIGGSTEFSYGLNRSSKSPLQVLTFRRVIDEKLRVILLKTAINRGVVIASSYLPNNAEFALAMSMYSLPVRWPLERPYGLTEDYLMRSRLSALLSKIPGNELTSVVARLLPLYLPMSIIENFKKMRFKFGVERSQVKLIFTANLHCSSDSFVIWAAEQRLLGATLVISQHGGLNGQGRLPTRGEEFEQSVADSYLHWGWAEGDNAQCIPAQIVAWAPARKNQHVCDGVLLVTDATFRHNRRPWAGVEDSSHYLEMLFTTYGLLPEDLKSRTVVRLHKDHNLYDDSHEEKWRAQYPHCKLDSGYGPMAPLVDAARLVVCTTLGTTEIEQFSRNVPTVLRLDRHIHALRRGEEDLFERMEHVGLIHYSAESLASFLRINWNSLGDWWSDPAVVLVVQQYLARFGHQSSRPIRDIRAVLRRAIAQGESR